MPWFSLHSKCGLWVFCKTLYQQAIANLDIMVAEPLLKESIIENVILVVTKMPLPLLAYFSHEGVMERVVRTYAEGALAKAY